MKKTQITDTGIEVSVETYGVPRIVIRDTLSATSDRPIRLRVDKVHDLIDMLNGALRHIQDPDNNRFGDR